MTFIKGYKQSEEHKRRNSEAKKGNTFRRGKKQMGAHLNLGKYARKESLSYKPHGVMYSENNPAWKGDKVGYHALHAWIRKNYGKANHCEFDKSHIDKRFEWANVSGSYLRDISDWTQLCSVCHRQYDSILRPKIRERDMEGRYL